MFKPFTATPIEKVQILQFEERDDLYFELADSVDKKNAMIQVYKQEVVEYDHKKYDALLFLESFFINENDTFEEACIKWLENDARGE